MVDATIRAFVAIELPGDLIAGLGRILMRLRERVSGADIKWVATDSIHVTLKFLGEMPASRVEAVREVLEGICAAAQPMQLGITALGAFPSPHAPRVVWVGLDGDLLPLASLAGKIDSALTPLGFEKETRPFAPHLTLGRVRQEASHGTRTTLAAAIASIPVGERLTFKAASASLMRSQLTPRGALYTRLAVLPFSSAHLSWCEEQASLRAQWG
jgi:2'-5' RNA ligase